MARKKHQEETDKDLNSNTSEEFHHSHDGPNPSVSMSGGEEGVTAPSDEENDPVAALRAELAGWSDKYLRLYSDFDNYRKRTMKERAELVSTATSGLITQLLPVLDDFDRALAAFSTSTDTEGLKQGVLLIHEKLRKVLAQKGLEEIKAVGEPFDTDLHEAITNLPAADASQKGRVVEEAEKGYLLNGKVIRFARVAVAN
jgi:molecular chaperone GrpE